MKPLEAPLFGSVLRIEKTSIHDGTGLRTVVFLKGCPLRCLWCSTPESQSALPQKGYARDRCTLCGTCIDVCPRKALSFSEDGTRIVTDPQKCSACFECARRCPSRAMKAYGSLMSVAEVVREIAKDEIFYFHSGGGVTISGGEPLEQADFVKQILLECRDRGIHRAVETSFFGPWEKIESLLPLLNLVHTDLKHPDPVQHRKLTGVDNRLILENIRKADASPYRFDLVIRTPLIPGINDSEEALSASAAFAKGLKKLKEVEFLAYHRLGLETYRNLGWDYPLEEIRTPDREFMLAKARFFRSMAPGIAVKINGTPVTDQAAPGGSIDREAFE